MLITNFASGELSPTLNGRVDLQQYYQAASRLENFEIIPTGGIKRRTGTKRLIELTKTVTVDGTETTVPADARIIPFILDKDNVFIFCLLENVMKVYKLQSNHTLSFIQDITEGYSYTNMAEIKEIQYAQNYDTMYLVHRSYAPIELKYSFTLHTFLASTISFDYYPDVVIDDDYDYIMIPAGALPTPETTTDGHLRFTYQVKSGTATVSVTKDYNIGITVAYAVKDGKLYKYEKNGSWLIYGDDPEIDTTLFAAANKYPGCVAFFNNRLFFASSYNKPGAIWASATPDTNNTRYNDFNTYKKYITVEQSTKDADIHTFTCDLKMENVSTTANTTTLVNVTQNFTIDGTLIKAASNYFCTGSNIPVGTKVLSVTSNSIVLDRAIDLEEDYIGQVMTIQLWRSSQNVSAEDYEYVIANTNVTTSDCGFYFELASAENDAVKFLSSTRVLSIGTESSIWRVDSGVTALNIAAVMEGRFGSDDLQGMAVAQACIYFGQGKKGIREFYYDTATEGFQTNNIAILAEHLLQESAVIDFDYVSNPYSRILCTRYDGTIAALLYDKTNGVMGWNRITRTEGTIRSVAVTRGQNENDYTFFTVKDGNKYYLEMLDPGSNVYLDSWQAYTDEVAGYTDAAILWNKTTGKTCGADNIPADFIATGDVVYIGYKIHSYIKSMPVMANDPTGKKRITDLLVRFLDSYMPELTITGLPSEKFTTITDLPYSGLAKVTYPGQSNRDVYFTLETDGVQPVNILSVNANIA